MGENGLRVGIIQSETVTGVPLSTFYFLLHEGHRYPIPASIAARYVLIDKKTLQFELDGGVVKIPDTYENKKHLRQ